MRRAGRFRCENRPSGARAGGFEPLHLSDIETTAREPQGTVPYRLVLRLRVRGSKYQSAKPAIQRTTTKQKETSPPIPKIIGPSQRYATSQVPTTMKSSRICHPGATFFGGANQSLIMAEDRLIAGLDAYPDPRSSPAGMNLPRSSRSATRARARPARTLWGLRRKAWRHRAQSAALGSSAAAISPSAGSGRGTAGVTSELGDETARRSKR